MCEQLARSRYLAVEQLGVEFTTSRAASIALHQQAKSNDRIRYCCNYVESLKEPVDTHWSRGIPEKPRGRADYFSNIFLHVTLIFDL